MLQILIIGSVWPEPASSGASLRLMQYIKLFRQQGWSVTFVSTAAESEFMADLEALSVVCVPVEVNASSFDAFLEQLQPDIVLFDRFSMEEQFAWRVEKVCPNALRLLETIDLHCLRHARHMQFKRHAEVVQHVEASDLYSEVAQREIASIFRSDLSILTSSYEVALLQEHFSMPGELICHSAYLFDASDYPTPLPDFEQRQHFMTIGNFRHAPNWDAVLWLKQQIWPLIRAQLPRAELHVYGAYAPPKATALHDARSGFHVLGRVTDVDAVMMQAKICLAPLRFGAGIKTKLADAMRNGTPSITTSVGAEGMSGGLSWGGMVTDDANAFADAAVHLYQQEDAWKQAQSDGFDILFSQFDMSINGPALIQRIHDLRTNIERHRLQNFTGSMLRHHQHRSTEFMSRWIEAKNKI
ncbi:MAG: glycosyltransferase [Mariprofundus sp.]|nr:glycosyltransferase [Mariprofundus sp.]